MSLLIEKHRLSVKPFAAVPALLDLPEIKRGPASVSNVSSPYIDRGVYVLVLDEAWHRVDIAHTLCRRALRYWIAYLCSIMLCNRFINT